MDGKQVAEQLSDFVNSSTSMKREEFVKAVTSDHRTLQQDMFSLFYACMHDWAEDYVNGDYDARNKRACELSYFMIRAHEKD